ncbi:MAG: SprB repeat-containing protein [Bacteroidota bacterium]
MRKLLSLIVLALGYESLLAQCFVSVSSPQAATCGLCNGSVEVVFSGGIPPYSVNFNSQAYGSATGAPLLISNACAGPFGVSVTDGNSVLCTGMLNGIVGGNSSGPLSLQLVQYNPTCPTCNDGSIQAQVSGGTAPYTFNWSNGSTSSSLASLQQGVYFLYVSDAAGCTAIDTVFLGSTLNNAAYLSGRVYLDADSNHVFSTGDSPLAYQQIECQQSGLIAYTNLQGEYFFPEAPGTYTISYVNNPFYSINNGTGAYNVTLGNTSITNLDFPLQIDSLLRSPQVYTYCPLPRCNANSTLYISLLNTGNAIDSGEIRLQFDPAMTFVSSQPAATLNGNTLVFGYSSLLPTQSLTCSAIFALPGAGSILNLQSEAISIDQTGTILASDTLQQSVNVLCAFDPNDKGVSPQGDGSSHRVNMNSELRYLVRFQNTGNDTAFNVLVTDTLAAGIDTGSVQVIASSHPCWVQRSNGNILRFYFTNIQLPDSNVNEEESHGYVLFSCTGNSTNIDPTAVTNSANIYFDANPPVITNSTLTTFSNLSTGLAFVEDPKEFVLLATPTPFQDYCTIQIANPDKGAQYSYRIQDMMGNTCMTSGIITESWFVVPRSRLDAGIYILDVIDRRSARIGVTRLVVH